MFKEKLQITPILSCPLTLIIFLVNRSVPFQVVYFTATYPLGILVVFLIRGLTTPGFNEGIDYYIIPKWEKLLNVEVSF